MGRYGFAPLTRLFRPVTLCEHPADSFKKARRDVEGLRVVYRALTGAVTAGKARSRREGIVMPHDSDIGFVCDPDQYAVFASTLWEVARPRPGDLDATDPAPATASRGTAARPGAERASDMWAEWATDPDWEVS